MYGYRVRLPAVIVQPRWATKVTVDDYSWHNDDAQAYLEIAILNAPSYTVQVADRPAVELHGAHIHCVVGDENFHCTAPPGVAVEIATVAVDLPGIDWSVVEFTEADYADTEVLLLPAVLPFSDSGEMREYEQCIHQYIQAYMHAGHASALHRTAIFFDLLYRLDTMVRQTAVGMTEKYIAYYVKKTDYAISTRFSEKLTVNLLASEFGITPSYLSSIYRAACGVTFSHRLTEVRINHAKLLLDTTELHLSEIAARVGYSSESHLRKRFRQHVGISITEYICINREQTLYHEKPFRSSVQEPTEHK